MAYVDLNSVRAKMSDRVDTTENTSAYERIHGVVQQEEKQSNYHFNKKPLFGFFGDKHEANLQGIPFSLLYYIELVDWSGRIFIEDKRGAISNKQPRLLSLLVLDDDTLLSLACKNQLRLP